MRVFAALNLSDEAADHLNLTVRSMQSATATPLRWVHHAQWHITTAFYGEVPEGAVGELAGELTRVAAASRPMSLHLSGAGSFAGRTLWMGVSGRTSADETTLVDLMRACAELGADRDRQRAHLTVARVAGGRGRRRNAASRPGTGLAHLVRALSVYRGPYFEVGEVVLYSSRLGAGPAGGPLHERLIGAPLGSPGPAPSGSGASR